MIDHTTESHKRLHLSFTSLLFAPLSWPTVDEPGSFNTGTTLVRPCSEASRTVPSLQAWSSQSFSNTSAISDGSIQISPSPTDLSLSGFSLNQSGVRTMLFGKDINISIEKGSEPSLHLGLRNWATHPGATATTLIFSFWSSSANAWTKWLMYAFVAQWIGTASSAAHGGYVSHNSWLIGFEEWFDCELGGFGRMVNVYGTVL